MGAQIGVLPRLTLDRVVVLWYLVTKIMHSIIGCQGMKVILNSKFSSYCGKINILTKNFELPQSSYTKKKKTFFATSVGIARPLLQIHGKCTGC